MLGVIEKYGREEKVYLFDYVCYIDFENNRVGFGDVSIKFYYIETHFVSYEFSRLKVDEENYFDEVIKLWYLGRVDELKEYINLLGKFFRIEFPDLINVCNLNSLVYYL